MTPTPRLALPYPGELDSADVPVDVKALADRIEALTAWIRQVDFAPGAGVFLPGDLKLSAAASTQPGWLACDGAPVNKITYPDLFAALGGEASPWGVPDVDRFNVPDLRSRVPIGTGTGAGLTTRSLADKPGAESVVLTVAQLALHQHPGLVGLSFITNGPGSSGVNTVGGAGQPLGIASMTDTAGSNQAHPNVQPSLAVNFFVKT